MTARLLRDMARILSVKNRLDEAEAYSSKSLAILQKRNHVDMYKSLEVLGEIYFRMSSHSAYAKNSQESQRMKTQALEMFKQALKVADQYFSRDSIHSKRIMSRIKIIEETKI